MRRSVTISDFIWGTAVGGPHAETATDSCSAVRYGTAEGAYLGCYRVRRGRRCLFTLRPRDGLDPPAVISQLHVRLVYSGCSLADSVRVAWLARSQEQAHATTQLDAARQWSVGRTERRASLENKASAEIPPEPTHGLTSCMAHVPEPKWPTISTEG